MNITCPSCKSRYSVDDSRVPPSGVTIRCPSCGHTFVARRPTAEERAKNAVALPGQSPQPQAQAPAATSGAVPLPGQRPAGAPRRAAPAAPSTIPLPGRPSGAPPSPAPTPAPTPAKAAIPTSDLDSLDLGLDDPAPPAESFGGGTLDFIEKASTQAKADPGFPGEPEMKVRRRNGRVEGPFGLERIKALLRSGDLNGNEDISEDGVAWRAMTAHPILNQLLNDIASAKDSMSFGQVDLDPAAGSLDLGGSKPASGLGDLDLGLETSPPVSVPSAPRAAPPPSSVDELMSSLDLDDHAQEPASRPITPSPSSPPLPGAAGASEAPLPTASRDDLEVGEIPEMPPLWDTYKKPIIAFLAVAALVLVGVVTHFFTPVGAFGIPALVEIATYEPPPPAPPPPPPAPAKLADLTEIQSLLDEHSFEALRSAELTLKKAGRGLPENALALAKTSVMATLAYGPDQFPLAGAQRAVVALSEIDPDAVEGLPAERVRAERLKAQAGLAVLEGDPGGAIDSLQKASEARPDDPELAYLLGRAHEANADTEKALLHYDRALVARMDHGPALRAMGRVTEALGDEVTAVAWYERAWKARATDARSARDAARLHAEAGREGSRRTALAAAGRGAIRGLIPEERPAVLLDAVAAFDDVGRLDEVSDLAMEAARLAPAEPRAVGYAAILKAQRGEAAIALKELDAVVARNPKSVDALVARARVHMLGGDVAKALLDLETARPLDPSARVLMWQARSNRQLGKLNDAERDLQLAARRPDATLAQVELARLAMAIGNVDEAFGLAQQAVTSDPKSLPAQTELGRVQAARGEPKRAEATFRAALAVDPSSVDARVGLANALRDQAARTTRPLRRPELGRAIATYLEVLRERPNHAAVLFEYGRVLETQGDLRSAIELYQQASALDEKDVRPHLEMVSALVRSSPPDLERARTSLKAAQEIELSTGLRNPGVRFWEARLALEDGKPSAAVKAMKQAVDLAPENADYRLWLGRALEANNSLFEAVAAYEAAVRLNSRLADAHRALGVASIERHRYQDARNHLDRFRELKPEDTSVWSEIGQTYAGENRDNDALKAFNKVLASNPSNLRALIETGKIRSRTGRESDAQRQFRKATRAHPEAGAPWCLLGLSLAQTRVSSEAKRALRACIDRDGPPDLAQSARELLGD